MEDTTTNTIQNFAETFCKNRLKYRNFTLRFVHIRDVADELVNESFARFWEKRNELYDENIEGYFYTILKHTSLDWLRRRQTQCRLRNEIYEDSYRLLHYDITSLETFDPNSIFCNEIRDIMLGQLKQMPELTRNIFLDSRFNNLSYEEIATKYSISKFKAKREIQATRSKLRIALKDYLPAPVTVTLLLICLNALWVW